MKRYYVKLINGDPSLNLKEKMNEITEVLNYISAGGKEGDTFEDVHSIQLVFPVHSNEIVLDVDENNDSWHKYFGNRLANKHDMRNYCNSENQSEMFKWEEH